MSQEECAARRTQTPMGTDALLLGDRYAPVTSSFGFLRADLEAVSETLRAWREQLHGAATATRLDDDVEQALRRLEPLTTGVLPRELVIGTRDPEWTAVVDCTIPFGNEVATVAHLSKALLTQGLAVTSKPSVKGAGDRPARYGARQFQLFGPLQTEFSNYVRSISVTQDGSRWRFDANGTVQDFEDKAAYERRLVRERFTSRTLVDYCAALGLAPFDDAFYTGPITLVENSQQPSPHGLALSLAEAQQRWGIDPRGI